MACSTKNLEAILSINRSRPFHFTPVGDATEGPGAEVDIDGLVRELDRYALAVLASEVIERNVARSNAFWQRPRHSGIPHDGLAHMQR